MEEEKTISMKDIMKVLLGNKWVYLIMAAAFAVVSFAGLKIYSNSQKEYVTFFDYDVAGFNRVDGGTAYFIDGEKFDPRSMITKEKLLKYVEDNESLKNLDVEEIIKKNAIKSFDYSATYKENDHQMNANDAAYITDKVGYKLVLSPSLFTYEQAQAFSEVVANEVINVTKTKIDHISYGTYLKFYDSTYSYLDQITYLNAGIDYINSLISSLSEQYGDVLLPADNYGGEEDKYYVDSKKLSDWQDEMNIAFDGYKVDILNDELELGGYIDERSSEYITSLKTTIQNLNREISTNQAILDKLTDQRDHLVSAIGTDATIESLEIGGYNSEIIELTKTIDNQKEQVARLEIQINKLDVDPSELATYNDNLTNFKNKLSKIRKALGFYTTQYESIAKKIMNDNMNVYYDSSAKIVEEGGMKTIVVFGASFAIGIFTPMLVNILIAGFALGEGKPILKRKNG